MIDPATYERYSVPLEQKMFELEDLLRDFLQAMEMCSKAANQEFLAEARVLGTELAGSPGDAALEVYDDLQRDLSHTRSFVQRWAETGTGATAAVLEAATHVRDGLQQMHDLVQSTPTEVMEEIKSGIRSHRATAPIRSRKDNLLFLGGLMLLVWCLLDGGVSELKLLYAMMYTVSSAPLLFWWKGQDKNWAFNLLFVLTLATALSLRILS